jgi:hypothetical protein
MNSQQTDLQQRLYDAAEAFYYAGILTSLPFDAMNVEAGAFRNAGQAAEAAAFGKERRNQLGAPVIVNFGFAIELYIKLLRSLADGKLIRGHNLHDLFLELETVAPQVGTVVINNHISSGRCRDDFLEYIKNEASVFDDWRYAYEKDFLVSSPDTLMSLVNAFRKTIRDLHPILRSAFQYKGK